MMMMIRNTERREDIKWYGIMTNTERREDD